MELFEKLCIDILASGNQEKGRYLIQWAAHIMQKPWEKCSVVPVLIGKQGTGKGLFCDDILGKILGPFFNKIMTARVLKERFNSEQSKKFLTFIDEATWRGDHEEAGILKGFTGSATMTVEDKFGARYSIDNPSRVIIASNNIDAVLIENSNRRFLVYEVSDKFIRDKDFYAQIFKKIKDEDFASNVYDYLLNVDLEGFNPFVFPKNLDNQGFEAKLRSYGPVAQFWCHIMLEEPAKIFQGNMLNRSFIFEVFKNYCNETKPWNSRGLNLRMFWEETKRLVEVLKDPSRDKRVYLTEHERPKIYEVTPFEFVSGLCTQFNIEVPSGFDDLDYIMEDGFKAVPEPQAQILKPNANRDNLSFQDF